MQGYCLKCRAMKTIEDEKKRISANGRHMVSGVCDQGHKISKIVSAQKAKEMED